MSTKEIKLNVGTDTGDQQTKKKSIMKMIAKGHSVKLSLLWKRNTFYQLAIGKKMMKDLLEEMKAEGAVVGEIREMKTNHYVMINAGVLK